MINILLIGEEDKKKEIINKIFSSNIYIEKDSLPWILHINKIKNYDVKIKINEIKEENILKEIKRKIMKKYDLIKLRIEFKEEKLTKKTILFYISTKINELGIQLSNENDLFNNKTGIINNSSIKNRNKIFKLNIKSCIRLYNNINKLNKGYLKSYLKKIKDKIYYRLKISLTWFKLDKNFHSLKNIKWIIKKCNIFKFDINKLIDGFLDNILNDIDIFFQFKNYKEIINYLFFLYKSDKYIIFLIFYNKKNPDKFKARKILFNYANKLSNKYGITYYFELLRISLETNSTNEILNINDTDITFEENIINYS